MPIPCKTDSVGSKYSTKNYLPRAADSYSTLIHKVNHVIHELGPDRSAWLHVVKGQISLNDLKLQTGDGAGFSNERSVSLILPNQLFKKLK